MVYSVSADRECVVDLRTGIDGEVWDINGPHLERVKALAGGDILTVSAVTHQNDVPLAVSEIVMTASPTEDSVEAASDASLSLSESGAVREFHRINLKSTFTLFKFVAHVTGNDEPDPVAASHQLCRQAAELVRKWPSPAMSQK